MRNRRAGVAPLPAKAGGTTNPKPRHESIARPEAIDGFDPGPSHLAAAGSTAAFAPSK